jgi:hypothetical protein
MSERCHFHSIDIESEKDSIKFGRRSHIVLQQR